MLARNSAHVTTTDPHPDSVLVLPDCMDENISLEKLFSQVPTFYNEKSKHCLSIYSARITVLSLRIWILLFNSLIKI